MKKKPAKKAPKKMTREMVGKKKKPMPSKKDFVKAAKNYRKK